MSQSKSNVHNVKVVNKKPGSIGVGANTEVYLDGVKLKGCTFFKFEAKAKKVNKVVIELIADVEIEGMAHVLGSYFPVPKLDQEPSTESDQ